MYRGGGLSRRHVVVWLRQLARLGPRRGQTHLSIFDLFFLCVALGSLSTWCRSRGHTHRATPACVVIAPPLGAFHHPVPGRVGTIGALQFAFSPSAIRNVPTIGASPSQACTLREQNMSLRLRLTSRHTNGRGAARVGARRLSHRRARQALQPDPRSIHNPSGCSVAGGRICYDNPQIPVVRKSRPAGLGHGPGENQKWAG